MEINAHPTFYRDLFKKKTRVYNETKSLKKIHRREFFSRIIFRDFRKSSQIWYQILPNRTKSGRIWGGFSKFSKNNARKKFRAGG